MNDNIYLTYYSKVRSTLTTDPNQEIARVKGQLVTKIIKRTEATLPAAKLGNMMGKVYTLRDKIARLDTAKPFEDRYTVFRIPKASGGYRKLEAPDDELKALQVEIKNFLQKDCKILCNNAVHSYVKHRNCKTAMDTHQKNKARWFLKLDIKNFFDNCKQEQLVERLHNIYPLCLLPRNVIFELVEACIYQGALPQGAPTSPILSNLYLMEFDYLMKDKLNGMCYTRYADDILISSPRTFNFQEVKEIAHRILPPSLHLNIKKTRYGSCNGSNWNLGLMYNKDQDVTIGYAKKHIMKCMIHNYYRDAPTHTDEDNTAARAHINGILGYYKFIEPNYFKPYELLTR